MITHEIYHFPFNVPPKKRNFNDAKRETKAANGWTNIREMTINMKKFHGFLGTSKFFLINFTQASICSGISVWKITTHFFNELNIFLLPESSRIKGDDNNNNFIHCVIDRAEFEHFIKYWRLEPRKRTQNRKIKCRRDIGSREFESQQKFRYGKKFDGEFGRSRALVPLSKPN